MSIKDLVILGCSSQQHTRFRNHGAYLFRMQEEGLLFDPGEGTQRQFIFADIAPTCVNRIFISHFHGDHCLGLSSMFLRLNLDKVKHPIHCYYPASGQKYFNRLKNCCIYHQNIQIIEHPVSEEGLVEETENFTIEAYALEHGPDSIGWRVSEKDRLKFYKDRLDEEGIFGRAVKTLEKEKSIEINGKTIRLEDVSYYKKGDVIAVTLDTVPCRGLEKAAKDATILLCESTYLDEHRDLAYQYHHMTATQAAQIAKKCNVKLLVLTHFSARYRRSELFENEAKLIFENTIAAEDLKKISFPD
ncbi:MAG TPA: ribonuclease Z [Chlamydiales bacterium]|nr:ribonuclease Z [Chlamydiales bacterium]